MNFLTGSDQATHSDSINMTTHPLGFMTGAWIAQEEITPDNGPLVYHPGNHRLPDLLNGQHDHGGNKFVIGEDAYLRYEQAVDRYIEEGRFEHKELLAQPGDVLFWHANLLHGGKRMSTPNASHKSMSQLATMLSIKFCGIGVAASYSTTSRSLHAWWHRGWQCILRL